jgi:hypothetical protein
MTALRPAHVVPIVLATILVGCGQPPTGTAVGSASAEAAGAETVQVSDQAGVTVKVTWAGTSAGAEFQVVLDTHSVDLDGLDLAGATLRNDRGERVSDAAWDAPKGGHHRAGALRFRGNAAPLLAGARWIELVIPNVADVPERVLRWQVEA